MKVGSAWITIKPDTSKFRGDLVRQLKPILASVEKQLSGVKVRASVDADVSRAVRGAKQLDSSMSDADRSTKSVDRSTKSLDQSLASLAGGIGAVTVAQGLLKTPAMIEGLTAALGVTTALGGATVALASALTPVAGLLPVAAAGGLAAAQGFGVMKLATMGLSDAMKEAAKNDDKVEAARRKLVTATKQYGAESSQAKSAQKALTAALDEQARVFEGLSPAAAKFGRLLLELQPKLKEASATAAQGFFPGAEKALRRLIPLFPTLNTVVGDTAKTLGGLAYRAGSVMGSPFFQARFAAIGARNATILDSLGKAAIGLVTPLTRLVDSAGPIAASFANTGERAAYMVDRFIRGKEESGALDRAFLTVERTLRRWGIVIANTGKSLGLMFREAFPAGQQYLAMLDIGTSRLLSMTRTAADSGALRRFFESTIPLVKELAGIVGDLTRGLGGIGVGIIPQLTPIARLIRSEMIPAIVSLVSSLDTDFLTAVVRLAATGTKFVETFLTATPVLTGAVAALDKLLTVANFLGNELGPLSPMIINTVAALSLLGTVAAGIKIGRLISDFAGARAGVGLLSGATDTATASTGRFSGALTRMGTVLRSLSIVAAVGYALKSTFDQLAPSVDKTVAAMAKGPKTAEAFYKELNKLNNPSLFDRFAASVKHTLDNPFRAAMDAMRGKAIEFGSDAETAFRKLAEQSGESAVQFRNALERSGRSTEVFDRILDDLGISQESAARAAQRHTDAINRQTDAFLEASANEVAYEEALDNMTDALGRNGRTFDANTAKGRENIRTRDTLIRSLGDMVSALVNEANQSGITQAEQEKLLQKLYALRDSGYPGARQAAEGYISTVNSIPPNKTTKINVDTKEAKDAIADIIQRFEGLDGRTATLSVQLFGLQNARQSLEDIKADFGDITKNFPAREHGGPARKGVAYVVGEKRPELFVPDEDGYILPKVPPKAQTKALGGGGSSVTFAPGAIVLSIDARGNAQPQAVQRAASAGVRSTLPDLVRVLGANRG